MKKDLSFFINYHDILASDFGIMADDGDDLYADLYGTGDAGGDTSKADSQGEDLLAYDDGEAEKKDQSSSAGVVNAKSSFIPPKPNAQSSFIPPLTSTSSNNNNSSFIPPSASTTTNPTNTTSSTNTAFSRAPIQTAPMTNTDNGRSNTTELSGMTLMQQNALRPTLPHEMPDEGKLFVGGLNWDTTDDGLKQYFTQFGKVNHCLIMRDPNTGRSRGFAFLTFDDPKSVNSVMVKEHFLDGKMIDPKRAIPRQENIKTAKCFVGGIPQSATSESFKAFFSQFGPLLDSTLMLDRDTQKPRGYGFVTYENDQVVEQLIQMENLAMDGKMIEVKRATPRNADGTRRQTGTKSETNQTRSGGNFGDDGNTGMSGYGSNFMSGSNDMSSMMMGTNPMASMMMNPMFNSSGSQSFDPNAMASFFQQQGGGGAFNPMMFQQMMMAANMGGMMGTGGGWSNISNMGGFGMGMGGNGASMNNNGNRKTGGRGDSADRGSNHDQDRNSRDRSEPSRGRPLNAPPSSAGLPTRPDGSNTNSGRDYQRERSPGRREDSSGAREGRW